VPAPRGVLQAQAVVIAWKETPQARRAVRDGLPFLKRAQRVRIVAVEENATIDRAALEDVASYLSNHQIGVIDVQTVGVGHSIAQTLMASARDLGADLIVAGGYGHSRLSESIFGGVTRDLLASSPICCLLSH
jgi:nucleotide-binding universal stress UspA family protein